MLNGSFADLQKPATLLPRNLDELGLFRRCKPDITIDAAKLSEQTYKAIINGHVKLFKDTTLRYRSIQDLIDDWPVLYHQAASCDRPVARTARLGSILRQLWAWLCQRGLEVQAGDIETSFRHFPESLLVFPLKGGLIRQFSSTSQEIPILILLAKDLEPLLTRITENQRGLHGILDESIIQKGLWDLRNKLDLRCQRHNFTLQMTFSALFAG
jgi:hypothetical protein